MITMLLGGLWHGAGWTFVIWGGLHGIYLMLNHAWRAFRNTFLPQKRFAFGVLLSRTLTFTAVVFAWVFFRADNLKAAVSIIKGMIGANGVVLPGQSYIEIFPFSFLTKLGLRFGETGTHFQGPEELAWIIILLLICNIVPNTYEIFHRYKPALITYKGQFKTRGTISWAPNTVWAIVILTIAISSILTMTRVSSFLYFQF